jgi:hypothetical protein
MTEPRDLAVINAQQEPSITVEEKAQMPVIPAIPEKEVPSNMEE